MREPSYSGADKISFTVRLEPEADKLTSECTNLLDWSETPNAALPDCNMVANVFCVAAALTPRR